MLARLGGVVGLVALVAVVTTMVLLDSWPEDPLLALAVALAAATGVGLVVLGVVLRPMLAMFRALGGTATSYQDGDYAFGLRWDRNDEIGDLVDAHNALGDVLRSQRQGLVQRELLLDTMVQNTPVGMLLVREDGMIVFANVAARHLLHGGRRVEGHALGDLVAGATPALREALQRGGDSLFTDTRGEGADAEEETWHLARRAFTLNGRRHELLLLRHLTSELRRQEVQTWKKVIRVLSHEMNNALAPLASLARSGRELVRRGRPEQLPRILDTVEERARHLERFLQGYVQFAKLPLPQREAVDLADFLDRLRSLAAFERGEVPPDPVRIDPAQLEQAVLNLVKNAAEAGSAPADIVLGARRSGPWLLLEVADRGSGMSESVMANALLPFYSTKRGGTGLGLALAREIAEAHGGRVVLVNREGGGLSVTLALQDTGPVEH